MFLYSNLHRILQCLVRHVKWGFSPFYKCTNCQARDQETLLKPSCLLLQSFSQTFSDFKYHTLFWVKHLKFQLSVSQLNYISLLSPMFYGDTGTLNRYSGNPGIRAGSAITFSMTSVKHIFGSLFPHPGNGQVGRMIVISNLKRTVFYWVQNMIANTCR